MKRILLVAGVLAIALTVGVCVHAATTMDKATVPIIPDDTVIQATEAEAPAATVEDPQPAEPQPVEPQPAEPQPAEPQPEPQPAVQDTAKGAVTEDAAKKTALSHAGVKESDTSYIYVGHEYDDGLSIYNVDFMVGTTEYEYEIDAGSGAIIEFDAESIYD